MVEITKVCFKRGTSRRSLNKKDIVVSTSSKSEDFRLFQIVGERYLGRWCVFALPLLILIYGIRNGTVVIKLVPLPSWPEFDFWTWVCCWFKGFSPGPPLSLSLQRSTFQISIRVRNSRQEEPPRGVSTAASRLLLIYLLSRLILTGREDRCRNWSPS